MEKSMMLKAIKALDRHLTQPVQLLIGGGAAMLLAYDVPISTMDIDGLIINSEMTPAELEPFIKKVASELKINPHWYSSYFSTFTYTIPSDYKDRLKTIYSGKNLRVFALGMEDLLIMKCFAGREKDIGHARAMIRKGANLDIVEGHIEKLAEKGIPGADKALEFLDELREQAGI